MKKTATLFLASLFSIASFSQNKGLQFDGQNDYVQAPEKSGVLTGNIMTFEAWIKPSNFNNHTSYIVNKGDNGYTWFCLNIMNDDMGMPGMPGMESEPALSAFISSNTQYPQLHYPISTGWINQWHHVAMTADGSFFRLYVDGVLVQSAPFSTNVPLNGQALHLGASSNWGNDAFAGTMDEVRIWNVARTQAQIQEAMYKEIQPTTPGLAAYYTFNEGVSNGNNTAISGVADLAAPGSFATLVNFAKTGTTSNFTTGYATLVLLPLKNNSFVATKNAGTVQLDWKAFRGEFAEVFEIERSNNGTDFLKIGTVKATGTGAENDYSFTDYKPTSVNYYRLKTSSSNGQDSYSSIVVIRVEESITQLRAYPNPVQNNLQLQVAAPKGPVQMRVKDLSGRTLLEWQVQSTGGALHTSVDVSKLTAGTYVVIGNNTSTMFVKQ